MANAGNVRSMNEARSSRVGVRASVSWPQERWVGAIVLAALGLLILIRLGFKGIGVQANIGGRVNV
jgi:hypothetical protein